MKYLSMLKKKSEIKDGFFLWLLWPHPISSFRSLFTQKDLSSAVLLSHYQSCQNAQHQDKPVPIFSANVPISLEAQTEESSLKPPDNLLLPCQTREVPDWPWPSQEGNNIVIPCHCGLQNPQDCREGAGQAEANSACNGHSPLCSTTIGHSSRSTGQLDKNKKLVKVFHINKDQLSNPQQCGTIAYFAYFDTCFFL